MPYRYITEADRALIEKLHSKKATPDVIATSIGVSLSTIYRELPKGYTGTRGADGRQVYSAAKAQETVTRNMARRGRTRRMP